jgi:PAS domain S-box-containing protein
MLTALDNRESRLQAIEAGADDFISKPFDRIELQARVCTITRLNRYRRLIAERTKFARVIEFSPDGLLIVNKTGEIQLANSAMGQLLRITEQDNLINQIIDSFVVVEQRNHCHTELQRIFNDPSEIARFETMLLCQDGTRIPVEMHVGWLEWDGYPAAQIVARDITKRKEAELLEEERRHIAYELHDGLAQIVTSTHQHLQAFASRFRPRSPQAQSDLSLAMTLAQRAVREVRRVIGGLRPTALDDFGITAALQMHVAALRAENWDITFEQTLGNERLSPTIETVVYRVTQEALTNIRKHAYPCRVHISLQRLPSELRLEIQDWGKGFDPNAVSESMALGEHIGLRGMRERVSLLGGQWCISSAINQGTHIIAQIPLSNTNKGECHDEG